MTQRPDHERVKLWLRQETPDKGLAHLAGGACYEDMLDFGHSSSLLMGFKHLSLIMIVLRNITLGAAWHNPG
jgi:hypothetical protein